MEIILIIIFIVFIVLKTKKSLAESNQSSASMPGKNMPTTAMNKGNTNKHPANYSDKQNVSSQTNRAQASSSPISSGSTTEYLNQKAKMDELDHQREHREEAMRVNKAAGGLRAAERLYEGDLVPNGKRCVRCSYCAADNLIPAGSWEKYSCYFCREPL